VASAIASQFCCALQVDIDRETVQESVRDAGVASVPTFSFYRGGKMIATFSGADRRQLENNLVNLVSLGG
jgi:Thioredoxin